MGLQEVKHWFYLWKEIGFPMRNASLQVTKEWKRRDLFNEWLIKNKYARRVNITRTT